MPPGSRPRSVYVVQLPYANLPPSTLVLETSGRVFQRTVRIGIDRPPDRNRRDAYFDVRAVETWRHADDETPARPLSVRLEPMPETELFLVVDEGDNAPLPITKARLFLPSYRLRFYHDGNAGVRLTVRPRGSSSTAVRPRAPRAARDGRHGERTECGTRSRCRTIVCRVFCLAEDVLDRADGSRRRAAGAHREVDSWAGGAGGELRFRVQGSGFKLNSEP